MTKKSLNFLETIEEKFSQLLMTDDEEHELKYISTGSISLNYSIGIGGVPKGRFIEIYGAESSGKTTVALTIARNTLKEGGKVLYIDAENGLDFVYIKKIIPEYTSNSFILLQPEFADQTLELAEKGLQSKEFSLIVVDSISAMISEKEKEKEFSESSMMVLAQLMSKFIKRNIYDVRGSETAFIFISQVRDAVGAYVPTTKPTGGHSISHICSVIIQLTANLGKDSRIMNDDEVIGNYITFVVKKNKVAAPLKTYSFPIIYGQGIDYLRDLVVFADVLGILTKAGTYLKFEDVTLGQGVNNTIQYLKEHPDTLDKIEKLIYNRMRKENENIND